MVSAAQRQSAPRRGAKTPGSNSRGYRVSARGTPSELQSLPPTQLSTAMEQLETPGAGSAPVFIASRQEMVPRSASFNNPPANVPLYGYLNVEDAFFLQSQCRAEYEHCRLSAAASPFAATHEPNQRHAARDRFSIPSGRSR